MKMKKMKIGFGNLNLFDYKGMSFLARERNSFSMLSENIISILHESLDNDFLVKYIYYTDKQPLSNEDLSKEYKKSLINEYILPVPFSPNVTLSQSCQLRAFYPDGDLENRTVLNPEINFQVIIHNNLWLIVEEKEDDQGKTYKVEKLRPYQIMDEIIRTFKDKSIDKVGIMYFDHFVYRYLNEEFGMYELFSRIKTF